MIRNLGAVFGPPCFLLTEKAMARRKKLKPDYFANVSHPRTGDGWRLFYLKQLGRKWATLVGTTDQITVKLSIEEWEKTPKHPVVRGRVQWTT